MVNDCSMIELRGQKIANKSLKKSAVGAENIHVPQIRYVYTLLETRVRVQLLQFTFPISWFSKSEGGTRALTLVLVKRLDGPIQSLLFTFPIHWLRWHKWLYKT